MEGGRPETAVEERTQFAGEAGPVLRLPTDAAPLDISVEKRNLSIIPFGEVRRTPALPRVGDFHALSRGARSCLAAEWERGTVFLLMPVLLCAGVLAYFSLPTEPGLVPLTATPLVLIGAIALAREKFVLRLMLAAALLFAAGMLVAKLETWRADTKMLGADITTRITGRIARIEHQASGRVRLTIDLISTARPKLRYAPDRIRATARSVPETLVTGSGVSGVVRLMSPSGPVRPQSYDFSFRSYFDGIGANGFFLTNPEVVDLPEPPPLGARLAAAVERMRAALAGHIRAAIGGPEGEIAAALVTGDTAGIPEDITEALRATGLAHVLSISGLHMALVAGTVIGLLRAAFAAFPGFASRHPVRKYAAAAALAAISFYLMLSGAGVATERSFIMLAVMLTALLFDRAALTMRNVAIAALVVIAAEPHEVAGPSFQMSFAATVALIGAYGAWSDLRRRRGASESGAIGTVRQGLGTAARYAGGLAMTSLIAGTATALFAAWHFQRIAPLGLAANLATMPIISIVVMPAAVVAMVLLPFGLDGLALAAMGKGIALFNAIAVWIAERSPFDATGAIPPAAVLLMTAGLLLVTLATTRLRLLSLPFLVLGVATMMTRSPPDLLISEDGRLVALALADGRLAVNRTRPSAFETENWTRAVQAMEIVKPKKAAVAMPVPAEPTQNGTPFSCNDTLCVARHESGAVIVHAADAEVAATACSMADLIIVNDATAKKPCRRKSRSAPSIADASEAPVIITKRDLARHGAAAVTFNKVGGGIRTAVTYSIAEPYRPWHAQRAFSRASRGLPPYRRKESAKPDGNRAGKPDQKQPQTEKSANASR